MQLNLGIILLLCVLLATWLTYGSRWAIAVAWGAALLAPTWIHKWQGPIRFDLQILVAMMAVGIACITGKWPRRFVWADLFVIGLAATQIVSEYLGGHFTQTMVFAAIADWMLPYIFGRIALQSRDDMDRLVGVATWCGAILAAWAAVESIGHFDPVKILLNHAGSLQSMFDVRWGLRRAEGPMEHPIFLGLTMVLLFPWTIAAADRAKAGFGPKWWKWAPWIVAGGAFLAMSRGPQIAVFIVLGVVAYFRLPEWRTRLVTIALGGVLILAPQYMLLKEALHSWSNEDRTEAMHITIRGESYEYSGTSHRLLQMLVFADSFLDAGWFGYGTDRVVAKDIPNVEAHLLIAFSSIDNHYLLHGLKNGMCGLACYLLLSAATLIRLAPAGLALRNPYSLLAAGLFGAISASLIILAMVYLADDFGFHLTFIMGAACSLRTCFDESKSSRYYSDDMGPAVVVAPRRRRLTVGHPQPIPLVQI
jgi:hypothetical protein